MSTRLNAVKSARIALIIPAAVMAGRIGVKMPESVSTIRATIFLSSFFSFPEPLSSSAVCSHISVSGLYTLATSLPITT